MGRNPFQGGMGISTIEDLFEVLADLWSQSLSGWDGDFHSTALVLPKLWAPLAAVAIPFRVGWGFPLHWPRPPA